MIAEPLPIPGAAQELAGLFLTRVAAAEMLGVDPATVSRWTANGIITAYYPRAHDGEKPAPMYYAAQVEQLAAAKRLLTPSA